MKIYSQKSEYTLLQGNMLDLLEVVPENSIDSVITDPPYELNFMGKGWDNSGIAFQKETWENCLKALKPGGYLLAFGGSRTYHRIACAIEDAGFEIRDCIMWLYGSGFPKSMDISKQIGKRGATSISWFGEYLRGVLKKRNMTYSDLAKHFPSKTGGITGCVHNRIEGKNMPTLEQFNKICEILNLPFDKLEEAEREVIGHIARTKGIGIPACGETLDRSKYNYNITTATTDLAKKRAGWGTALKPSYEPIIVARKPLEGSCTDNVIKYGVGGINIDECRVGTDEVITNHSRSSESAVSKGIYGNSEGQYTHQTEGQALGRFPANTILTYDESDFEEVCGGFPDTKSQRTSGPLHDIRNGSLVGSSKTLDIEYERGYNDEGSAARYFYCAKASRRDRDEGLGTETIIDIILADKNGKIWKGENIIRDEKSVNADIEAYLKSDTGEYEILNKEDLDLSIILYMKNIIEKYLNECKSTTKMGINSTTIYQILNWLIHLNTKENTLDVKQYDEKYISHVESAENGNLFEITIKEKSELVHDVNNAVLKMQLRIREKEKHSTHPTVKPTDLMQYLVRLVTPNGGTVLDPFNGSGSTGKAVMYENKDRNKNYKYIGIELTEEYLPIAKARIEYVINKGIEKEKSDPKQEEQTKQRKESALF